MEKREIILEYDTVVIGGGVAGSAAAIAGARAGAKTLLIEAEGALGGQATIGLVTPLSSVRSRKGVPFGGILEELRQMTYALTEKYVSQDYKNDKSLKGEFIRLVLSKEDLTQKQKEAIIECGLRALAGETI